MSNEVWQFDPNAAVGSRWVARAPSRWRAAYVPAATIGSFIYTAGGSNLDAGGLLIDTVESFIYDPVGDVLDDDRKHTESDRRNPRGRHE